MTTTVSAPAAAPVGNAPHPDAKAPAWLRIWFVSALTLTGLMAASAAYGLGLSALQEQRSQHQLYATLRGVLDPSSELAPPVGGNIPPGTGVALLNAPDAGLSNTVVVEGTSSGDLQAGPGHLRDSPLPGQLGDAVLMGRSLLAGGPFRHVDRLRVGDPITVTTGQGTFHFTVRDLHAAGAPAPATPPSGSLLTLVTSYGAGPLGHLAPSHVIYVDAALQGKAVADSAGRPVAVPSDELPGAGDPSAWPFVLLWLIALVATAGLVVWGWVRWNWWQTWLLGIPVLFGLFWGLAETGVRLLPNIV